jgi:hypothetical protein
MDQKLKDDLDARRFRTAVAKGLDLAQVLQVVFGGRDEALSGKKVGALAALRRLEREIRLGRLSVKAKGKKHIPLSLLKGLVGEGHIRVERLELSPDQKRKELKRAPPPAWSGLPTSSPERGEGFFRKTFSRKEKCGRPRTRRNHEALLDLKTEREGTRTGDRPFCALPSPPSVP